jgi:hypothetical protein
MWKPCATTSRPWCWMPRCSKDPQGFKSRQEGEGDRDQAHRPPQKHAGNPKFTELGERLEKIREKARARFAEQLGVPESDPRDRQGHRGSGEAGDPEEEKDKALSALTELFNEVKSKNTHVIVERIVADIDAIVKQVRFDGWQGTPPRRTRGETGPAPHPAQIQAAHRSGAFRQGLRIHPAVLLIYANSNGAHLDC